MILYLCRHGIAQDAAPGLSDDQRELTPEGRKKLDHMARGFRKQRPDVGLVVVSPLIRARQTAEILARRLGRAGHEPPQLLISEHLGPPGNLPAFIAEMRLLHETTNVIAVGHEPTLGQFVGKLCFGHEGGCPFKKGQIAAIDLDLTHGRGELLYFIQPRQMRAMA